MNCEYEYCIYNSENECVFEEVTINNLGMCDDCIIISLDKDFLDMKKKQQLQDIKNRWNDEGK